jgi:phosphate transport system permease protein
MKQGRKTRDHLARGLMRIITLFSILLLIVIFLVLIIKAWPVIKEKGLYTLLTTASWRPSKGEFGFLTFLVSTLYVSFIAILIALPLSLLTAIYMNSYASGKVKQLFEPISDLLSGIPPVIYGVWGTLTIVPLIAKYVAPYFSVQSTGHSLLAGGIVLAVMIIPLLTALLTEIFNSIPSGMIEASLSLGATRWQTVKYVIIRRSLPGIFAATVLALSRAFGETMAVLMVCGNSTIMPRSILDGCYPLPALIANNYGEMLSVKGYESALMLAALILFVMIFAFNALSSITLKRIQKRFLL